MLAKISFERAATVFRDNKALSIPDEEHSDTEERWITLGLDNTGILLVFIHDFTYQSQTDCIIRLISARKATKEQYFGQFFKIESFISELKLNHYHIKSIT